MRLSFFLLLCASFFYAQLRLQVKELNYDENLSLIPGHYSAKENETKYKGHIFEITIENYSDKPVSLPLDTLSFALPFSDNDEDYFTEDNLVSKPDIYNTLGLYAFVYQQKFIEGSIGDDPLYDAKGFEDLAKINEERVKHIQIWNEQNQIPDKNNPYNWYISKSFITIASGQVLRYVIHFNPFLKMHYWYSQREFYDLHYNKPYSVTFKLIRPKILYRFLTAEQRKAYPHIYVGSVTSNTLFIPATVD